LVSTTSQGDKKPFHSGLGYFRIYGRSIHGVSRRSFMHPLVDTCSIKALDERFIGIEALVDPTMKK
jgi:hypothetical protein